MDRRCSSPSWRGSRCGRAVGGVRSQRVQPVVPASQNQGVRQARADILCFFNNDIWLPHGGTVPSRPSCARIRSSSSARRVRRPTDAGAMSRLMRRWKRVVFRLESLEGVLLRSEDARLWWMVRAMYGDLEHFHSPSPPRPRTIPGINGSVVAMHATCCGGCRDLGRAFSVGRLALYLTLAPCTSRIGPCAAADRARLLRPSLHPLLVKQEWSRSRRRSSCRCGSTG